MLVPCAKILHIIECAVEDVEVDGPLHVAYNIPCIQNVGIIGDQFSHSVADDLNKYYEQFPCMGTPR